MHVPSSSRRDDTRTSNHRSSPVEWQGTSMARGAGSSPSSADRTESATCVAIVSSPAAIADIEVGDADPALRRVAAVVHTEARPCIVDADDAPVEVQQGDLDGRGLRHQEDRRPAAPGMRVGRVSGDLPSRLTVSHHWLLTGPAVHRRRVLEPRSTAQVCPCRPYSRGAARTIGSSRRVAPLGAGTLRCTSAGRPRSPCVVGGRRYPPPARRLRLICARAARSRLDSPALKADDYCGVDGVARRRRRTIHEGRTWNHEAQDTRRRHRRTHGGPRRLAGRRRPGPRRDRWTSFWPGWGTRNFPGPGRWTVCSGTWRSTPTSTAGSACAVRCAGSSRRSATGRRRARPDSSRGRSRQAVTASPRRDRSDDDLSGTAVAHSMSSNRPRPARATRNHSVAKRWWKAPAGSPMNESASIT